MKLIYVCTWDKIKETTFSGTTYFLFKALKNKIEVEDYDVKLNLVQKVINKLSSIRLINGRIVFIKLFNRFENYIYQKKMDKIKNGDNKVLQIGSFGVCDSPFCTYQDLSIDSLIYFKENKPELFKYSGFQNVPVKMLQRMNVRQKKLYDKAEYLFTMSEWLRENLIQYTGIDERKVYSVGAGINIDKKKIVRKNKTNTKILFVGRDFFRKGGDITFEAFKILKEKYIKEAELYVAGPEEWPLKETCDGVKFLGNISYDKLSDYFNMCDIFCLPSRFEAYGLVFGEALAYGLPCIARNEFAMKEFIQDSENGYLINDDNIEELALKMYKLLTNNEIKSNVLENQEYYLNKYSWDNVAEKIINIMNSNN